MSTIDTTPRIHCREGITARIPDHLIEMVITPAFLQQKSACSGGLRAFKEKFPNGAPYPEVRAWLAEIQKGDWEAWIQVAVGGDVATAGDSGTATAGDSGTATAGYRGTATAGDRGTATAGDRGTATAGDSGTATAGYRGTATAGDSGTATAGDSGTATAGDSGVITIEYFDSQADRYKRMIGYIGEGGLEPNKKYRLNEQAQFEPAEG